MSPFLHWSRYSIPLTESACRWPMKLEGTTEMKRRSVMIPVSMLLNSSRVWAPVMWPTEQNMQFKLQIPFNIFVSTAPSLLLYLPQSHCPQRAANSSRAATPSPRATHCHSACHLPAVSLVPCLREGKSIKWQSYHISSSYTPHNILALCAKGAHIYSLTESHIHIASNTASNNFSSFNTNEKTNLIWPMCKIISALKKHDACLMG